MAGAVEHDRQVNADAVLAEMTTVVEEVRRKRLEQQAVRTVVDPNLFVSVFLPQRSLFDKA